MTELGQLKEKVELLETQVAKLTEDNKALARRLFNLERSLARLHRDVNTIEDRSL